MLRLGHSATLPALIVAKTYVRLAWRPSHRASAQNMDVQVRHGFAAIGPIINDDAEAGSGHAFLLGQGLRDKEQVSEQRLVGPRAGADARDHLLGHDEEMDGRLRMNVVEGQALVILVDNPGRDLAGDDLLENGAHKGAAISGRTSLPTVALPR